LNSVSENRITRSLQYELFVSAVSESPVYETIYVFKTKLAVADNILQALRW